jgi:hypothetical protein
MLPEKRLTGVKRGNSHTDILIMLKEYVELLDLPL